MDSYGVWLKEGIEICYRPIGVGLPCVGPVPFLIQDLGQRVGGVHKRVIICRHAPLLNVPDFGTDRDEGIYVAIQLSLVLPWLR